MQTTKFTIISDPGIDDLISLLLLNKLSPTLEHTLVSTFGNVPENHTSRNAQEFVAFAAPHWHFCYGAQEPLRPLERPWATYFHGPDGVWQVHPKVEISEVEDEKGGLLANSHLISLGPMTVVYEVLDQRKVSAITIMGGALGVGGNETPYAETNIAFDPDAAAHFFDNCHGIDVKLVPLDVTKKVFWTKVMVSMIPEDEDYKIWAKKLLLAWFENYGDKKQQNFDLHDPLAIYSIFFPDRLEWRKDGVRVITKGKKRGQTVFDPANPECKTALGLQDPKAVANEIFNLIFKPISKRQS